MDKEKLIAERDRIKAILNKPDPLAQSFYGGRVGFKSGAAKRKFDKSVEQELHLWAELKRIEGKLAMMEIVSKRVKAKEVEPSIWKVGETAYGPLGNRVTILKINSKTVTIQYSGGFKETIKPHLLSRR